jgi:ABC-type branched-subunit amino acid transport system substrate-binding protein
MPKKIITVLLVVLSLLHLPGYSQQGKDSLLPTYQLGIFAPLYLDSVFNDEGQYRYGKSFPKFALQGLDFIQGAQIALDSMPLHRGNIHAQFFDSKSTDEPLQEMIRKKKLDSLDMIIGSVKDNEYQLLADFAKQKNIPFISATYPNDGGITANPFVVVMNSTLKAHCEAIFAYLLQNHGTDRILLVRKPGSQEDKVAEYFKAINSPDGKPLLNIQTITIKEDFELLDAKMDSTRENIIIGGSLNEAFATKLANKAYALNEEYDVTLIGMPNWDGFSFLKKNSLKDFPVYYTSPYFNYKWDQQSKQIQAVYKKKYKGVPSDLTYKGYETVYLFARLLTLYPNDLVNHLNEFPSKVFNEYNFKPVFNDKKASVPDYFENKHLYFIKVKNGAITKAW